MTKVNDLTGKTFGRLTVISMAKTRSKDRRAMWFCKCECGEDKLLSSNALLTGNSMSCGCLNKQINSERSLIDISGQKFGRLTVIKRAANGACNKSQWEYQCDCGNDIVVIGNNLKRGIVSSCGCIKRELLEKKNFRHGGAKRGANDRAYSCLDSVKYRVSTNIKYIQKGTSICDNYKNNYEAFKLDLGPITDPERNTVDRIDNDGHYSCGKCAQCIEMGWAMNVRWATPTEQANNTRRNKNITHNGKTQSISMWAREVGINQATLWHRITVVNWTVKDALETPVKKNYRPDLHLKK